MTYPDTAEHRRMAASAAREADWKNWGPYVAERTWGTVREDYSPDGSAWEYFPFDHAVARAYRWNEDGLGGVCNRFQNLCLAVALWNERDPILKERLFGLTGTQGNHGEDVKEVYAYLDGLPSHAYMKMLYRYPQVRFPYGRLVEEDGRRGRGEPEFELADALADAFAEGRYFDVLIEYAKRDEEDLLCRITATNRGPEPAPLHVLPHLWFRKTWGWGYKRQPPALEAAGEAAVKAWDRHLGDRWWYVDTQDQTAPRLLFTENATNHRRLFNRPNEQTYTKDGINDAVVDGDGGRVNPDGRGTKAAAHVQAVVRPGEAFTVRVRLSPHAQDAPFDGFDDTFRTRIAEADAFYAAVQPEGLDDDRRRIERQALAGLLWNKQFYHYGVQLWQDGDPAYPSPPQRRKGRNAGWRHLYCADVLSVPDKWEFPWFASWDLALQTVPLARVDPEWAKRQLILLLREWYMHPSGQLPGGEWSLDDANPPVHAWAAWEVHRIASEVTGEEDPDFLERIFHKLLLNFTWWVNRLDADGNNVFQGGFLGLDNIAVFDRSGAVPGGGHVEQADGTAWMAAYCLAMLRIALHLARTRPAYEDVATKFFEHFIYIAGAITNVGGGGVGLWDEVDGFFYDVLHLPGGRFQQMRARSYTGLIPLLAAETVAPDTLDAVPDFRRRMEWFLDHRPWLLKPIAPIAEEGEGNRRLLAICDRDRLERVLARVFDEDEFLSPYGLRSLSKAHETETCTVGEGVGQHCIQYEPGESQTALFGGNSNWRGPVWMPINFLFIQALRTYHRYYGDAFTVEVPTGSGNRMTLAEAADDLARRLISLFTLDANGRRPGMGEHLADDDPLPRQAVLFHEYFHGDTGEGLGASHQTGWTALVANLIQPCLERDL